jgi:RecA-family ATPase
MALKIEENPFAQKLGVEKWQRKELVVPKPDEYLVAEMVPATSLVSLQTNGVYGKTTLAMQLAMSVAFDIPFLDSFACQQPGKVLFLNARETDDDNHRRFKRLVRELSHTVPDISEKIDELSHNLTFVSLYDECFDLNPQLVLSLIHI